MLTRRGFAQATSWRRTVWGRFPMVLARPVVYRSLALAVFLAAGLPSIYVLWQGDQLTKPLIDFALARWFEFGDSRALFEGMSPEQRAAFPQRLEGALLGVLPELIVAGLLMAVTGALTCLGFGRFLQRHGDDARDDARDEVRVGCATQTGPLWSAGLAGLAGFLAHLPFLLQSFDTDEAWTALNLSQGWFTWASTWQGWEVHMGGALLGRLAYAVFGFNDFFLRVPSAALSAVGVGITYRWTHARYGPMTAWLTIGLLCALPLWAELTAHLRGYGLLFFAGAWNISVLWQLLDGPAPGTEPRVLAAFFLSLLLGFFAHFFFVFYGIAALLLLAWQARFGRNALAIAGLAWGAVALVPAGLLYLPGLPTVLYETTIEDHIEPVGAFIATAFPVMVGDLGFPDPGSTILVAVFLMLFLLGLFQLERVHRTRVLVILAVSVGMPLVMRPVVLGARFFIHLLPFVFVAVLPLSRWLQRLPSAAARIGLAAAGVFALWAFPAPYGTAPLIDLRGACSELVRMIRPGDEILIDNFLVVAKVYLPDRLKPRYVNTKRALPSQPDLLMISPEFGGPPPRDYVVVAHLPGKALAIVIYRRRPSTM